MICVFKCTRCCTDDAALCQVKQLVHLAQSRLAILTWQKFTQHRAAFTLRYMPGRWLHCTCSLIFLPSQEGEACPALYEKLLARLQEPPLMSLLRHQQHTPLWEQHAGVCLNACSPTTMWCRRHFAGEDKGFTTYYSESATFS